MKNFPRFVLGDSCRRILPLNLCEISLQRKTLQDEVFSAPLCDSDTMAGLDGKYHLLGTIVCFLPSAINVLLNESSSFIKNIYIYYAWDNKVFPAMNLELFLPPQLKTWYELRSYILCTMLYRGGHI